MTLTLPNDIVNQTPADATAVEQNYNLIEQYINNDLINRDGSVAMTAPLLLAGDPTQPNAAATKAYVDAVLPIGLMIPYGGVAAPAGGKWALCNGASLATATYPELFAVIGYRYGGSGASFALPNMRQRFPIGVDDRAAGTADTRFDATGKIGGTWTVPIPQHSHPQTVHQHAMPHTHEHPHTHVMPHTHEHPHTHTETVSTSVRQSAASGTTNSFMPSGSDGTTRVVANNPTITVGQPNEATTGPVSTPSTGVVSEATTGPVSTPNTASSTAVATGNTGVTGTAAQLIPQFVVMSYLMRVA